jgi:hypothetical protein
MLIGSSEQGREWLNHHGRVTVGVTQRVSVVPYSDPLVSAELCSLTPHQPAFYTPLESETLTPDATRSSGSPCWRARPEATMPPPQL